MLVLRAYDGWLKFLEQLPSPLLLAIRLVWGLGFFQTGLGKLQNLERTAGFFASIGIPAPKLNAMMAGGTEMVGGILLIIGLGGRIATVPLIFTMLVAFATADRDSIVQAYTTHDLDKLTSAAPFPFLLACLLILVFGPGKFSLDQVIGGLVRKKLEGEGKSK
jgi:putative oxidoreductase